MRTGVGKNIESFITKLFITIFNMQNVINKSIITHLLTIAIVALFVATPIALFAAGPGNGGGGSDGGGDSGGGCCDGGGSGSEDPDPPSAEPDPAPTCDSFTVSPASVTYGSQATFAWQTSNATAVSINVGVGSVAVDGTFAFSATVSFTATLTATGPGGTVTCTASLVVTPLPIPAPTCDSFTVSPATINPGDEVTLAWTTSNATSVVIYGSVPVDGSTTFVADQTTTFPLTATGPGGTVSCAVTLTVVPLTSDPAPTCDSFTVSPATVIYGGASSFVWQTSNATAVSINGDVGSVPVDGTFAFSATKSYTYTLTATGPGGTVTCTAAQVVTPTNPVAITCGNNVSFSANTTSINEGDTVTLNWSTVGITSVQFEGISDTSLSGSTNVSPNSDTTYTLIASDATTTLRCPVTISVDEDNGGGSSGGSSSPSCKLTISDDDIALGERVTIKWDTSNATEVILKDSFGKILSTTEDRSSSDKKELYDGEITLRPEKDTTYTLTAEKGSKDRDCDVEVEVSGAVAISEVRDQQPLVSGIALTQVPYTGFAAGPFLTGLFYSLLALWALYLAYILVVRKNGVTLATTPATATVISDTHAVQSLFAPKVMSAPDFHQKAAIVPSVAVVGYAAAVATEVADIEKRAHLENVLLSADALAELAALTDATTVDTVVTDVFAKAKASYPSEDGWVVLSKDRLTALVA